MRPALLLLMCFACRTALAEDGDDARARDLFDNGSTLYEEGRYVDAITAWKSGYELSERPLFLFNIANAYERQGDVASAVTYLDAYRAYAPAEEQNTLIRRIEALEERLRAEAIEPSAIPWAPITAFSVAGLSFGLSGAYGLSVVSARSDVREWCVDGLCVGEARLPLQRDKRRSAASDVALGVGFVAAAVGVATLVAHKGVEVHVGPGTVGLGGRF